MSGLLIIVLVTLIFLVLYQLGRSSEMIATLQGEEEFDKKRNKWLGYSMLGVFAVLMGGIVYTHYYMLPLIEDMLIAASDHGEEYDRMFLITLIVTGIVFFITQFLCFYFAFRYRDNGKNKPVFFAHSNKLEMIWTTVPALAMAILVAFGLKAWFTMTNPVPAGKDKQIIEIIGKQFNWISRYPGKDGVIGKKYFTNINEENNILGLDWTDPACKDDIVIPTGELRLVVGKPVELIIGSRDVIHDVGLAHFRMKMDAVPGITTRMWFTPTITTDSMKILTENPDFVYELSCDQMCGKGHYSMRAVVYVQTQAEHDKWLAEQKTYYEIGHPEEFETEEAADGETSEGEEAKEEETVTMN
jgi:cytochrome c oxidase subunit 2